MEYSREDIKKLIEEHYLSEHSGPIERITNKVWAEISSREKQKEQPDPYLQPGWPCEVWDGEKDPEFTTLAYYERFLPSLGPAFCNRKSLTGMTTTFEYYRPFSTEWDFAPEWADRFIVDEYGFGTFNNVVRNSAISLRTVLPKNYYGQTIPRPEWAKE